MSIIIPTSLDHRKIPLKDLQAQIAGKRITVGVAIVSKASTDPTTTKLLLLQRAAEEEVLPNMYELPGGNCEATDATILDTVQREAFEETGLVITEILAEFESFEYTTKRGPALQLNFIVVANRSASEPTPTLSPDEHQAYRWAAANEFLSDLPMSAGMSEVVQNAYKAIS